jgi:hypothetical protein
LLDLITGFTNFDVQSAGEEGPIALEIYATYVVQVRHDNSTTVARRVKQTQRIYQKSQNEPEPIPTYRIRSAWPDGRWPSLIIAAPRQIPRSQGWWRHRRKSSTEIHLCSLLPAMMNSRRLAISNV